MHTGLLAETTRYYRVFAVNSVNMPTGMTSEATPIIAPRQQTTLRPMLTLLLP